MDADKLAYNLASMCDLGVKPLVGLLDCDNATVRLQAVLDMVNHKCGILEVASSIQDKVNGRAVLSSVLLPPCAVVPA